MATDCSRETMTTLCENFTAWSPNSKMAYFDDSHVVVDGALVHMDTGAVVQQLPRGPVVCNAGLGAVAVFLNRDLSLWLISDTWQTSVRCVWVSSCVTQV